MKLSKISHQDLQNLDTQLEVKTIIFILRN